MDFSHIFTLLSFHAFLAFAEYEDKVYIVNSKFGPLKSPEFQKKNTVAPQMVDLTDILATSNAIKKFQKKLEEDDITLPTMQAYLTTTTATNSGREFNFSSILSSVLCAELVTDNTNTSQPSVNELLVNVTAANSLGIVNCTKIVPLNQMEFSVEIVNSSRLGYVLKSDAEIISSHESGICSLVLFYARSCQFSTLAAPHFNIFPRIFPQIKMVALNAVYENRLNSMYGITGVPSLVLFHNGIPIAKYNGSDYSLYEFTKFVMRHTDLAPNEKVEISVSDFVKPIPGFGNHDYDYYLWLAWFVIIFWSIAYIRTMHFWRRFVEDIKNIWREVEAQHEHTD